MSSQHGALSFILFVRFIPSVQHCAAHTTAYWGKITTKARKTVAFQWFVQRMQRLISEKKLLRQIVPHHAYLDLSFVLCGVQQGHFEGGGFKSLGTFLGRFEVFAWGRPLRHVICFSVFVKILGVLFLKIKKRQSNGYTMSSVSPDTWVEIQNSYNTLKHCTSIRTAP